ncbi:hypothetical protein Glove_91g62 [Diversispora epigaea]|uniref:non-specific serine/threonine protein kinase n=1 Tax=Diversispora epigaea TaxID=1348612 RepID=A0A397J5D5_9GLOM|nr:hypothetical protein Glove_91g62 [Diversispora epigaea]
MSQLDENAKEWEIWRWIDYSKFKNIEYLAEGVFSRIWKAEWKDMPEELFGFYNSDQVALKKQQISFEFLKELTVNFHCRDSCSKICLYYFQNFGLCHDCGNLNRYKNICLNCKLIEINYLSKWTSGNYEIDKIIHMSQLDENAKEWEIWRWIDYSKFKNIEYLAEGVFSRIWKAEWKDMPEELFGFYNSDQVALKKQQISFEFLKELTVNFHCRDRGLKTIHSKGFIHRDLHPGNLMITEAHNDAKFIRLGDLGFCRPVNEILSSGTYGVLPYIAPEVMNNNKYTQASDIYSVGIIMWVISTGKIPFEEELYDPKLAIYFLWMPSKNS